MVKGRGYSSDRIVGHALQASKIYNGRGVDELILLDVTATQEGREPNYEMVEELTNECFMPITVGGGVNTIDHVNNLLRAGADKVSICTAALLDYTLIQECASMYGSQAIVVSVDVKEGVITTHSGRQKCDMDVLTWTKVVEDLGAGEILLNSVDRDGTMEGYDLELIKSVSENINIPLIASGGCGSYEHMHEALEAGADAVAAGAMFIFQDKTPKGAANYLKDRGWEVRQ